MESQIISAIVAGIFSLLTGLASVWLKNSLERRASSEQGSDKQKKYHRSWRVFMILVIGLILGAEASATHRYESHIHYGALIALVLMILSALFLAISNRKGTKAFWPFQLEHISMWFAFGAGYSLVHGSIWSDLVSTVVLWWFCLALVGGIIAGWKKRAAAKHEELSQQQPQQPLTPVLSANPVITPSSNEAATRAMNPLKEESPLDIVKRRYAKGEITKEQFDQMKEDLN